MDLAYQKEHFEASIIYLDFATEKRCEQLCGTFPDFVKFFNNIASDSDASIIEVKMNIYADERGVHEMYYAFNDRLGIDNPFEDDLNN